MNLNLVKAILLLLFAASIGSCQTKTTKNNESASSVQDTTLRMGAELTDKYYPLIKGKRIAILSNHTGMVGDTHLLDMLLKDSMNVVTIFSPEHGFRGDADAGEHVNSSIDEKTGIPISSLYDGKDKKPSQE